MKSVDISSFFTDKFFTKHINSQLEAGFASTQADGNDNDSIYELANYGCYIVYSVQHKKQIIPLYVGTTYNSISGFQNSPVVKELRAGRSRKFMGLAPFKAEFIGCDPPNLATGENEAASLRLALVELLRPRFNGHPYKTRARTLYAKAQPYPKDVLIKLLDTGWKPISEVVMPEKAANTSH